MDELRGIGGSSLGSPGNHGCHRSKPPPTRADGIQTRDTKGPATRSGSVWPAGWFVARPKEAALQGAMPLR